MATAKKTARKSAAKGAATDKIDNSRWAQVQVPEGYRVINSGEFGERWEFEDEPLIEGTVTGKREVETGTGKNKRTAQVMSVQTAEGKTYDVWESAALTGLFLEAEEGTQVAIAFQGYRDVGRPQPMKVFQGAIVGEAPVKAARRRKAA